MRWLYAADGIGPDYCDACQKSRQSSTRCDECPEPRLLPECEPAAELYHACCTQWRRHAGGAVAGLDYSGVEAAARMMGMAMTPELFAQLRVLEAETVKIARPKRDDQN